MLDPLTKEETKQLNVARVRDALFDSVHGLWLQRKAAGLNQREFAKELGRDRGWVSRTLRGPGNWTVRTVAELLMALDGRLEVKVVPRELPSRENYDHYAFLISSQEPSITNIVRGVSVASHTATFTRAATTPVGRAVLPVRERA